MSLLVVLFVIIKNAIYGLSVFFTGNLTRTVDVLDVLALRFLLSFLVLFGLKLLGVVSIKVGIRDIVGRTERKKFIKPLLLTALFEPVLYMLFETLGISMTTNVTAGVLLSLSPIFCCIAELLFLREKASPAKLLLLVAGIVGVAYIAINTKAQNGRDSLAGILFMLLAVICGALFCAFSRKSSKYFLPFEVTYITCMLGALVFNLINVVRHLFRGDILQYFTPFFNGENLLGFFYLSVLSTIVATGMNNFALAKAQISSLAAFSGVSTIVTIAAGVLLEGEKIYYFHYIGVGLILLRIVGVTWLDRKERLKSGR